MATIAQKQIGELEHSIIALLARLSNKTQRRIDKLRLEFEWERHHLMDFICRMVREATHEDPPPLVDVSSRRTLLERLKGLTRDKSSTREFETNVVQPLIAEREVILKEHWRKGVFKRMGYQASVRIKRLIGRGECFDFLEREKKLDTLFHLTDIAFKHWVDNNLIPLLDRMENRVATSELGRSGFKLEKHRDIEGVVVAPLIFRPEHFAEVDDLIKNKSLKTSAALEAVAEKHKFNYESFKRQYYYRHANQKRKESKTLVRKE